MITKDLIKSEIDKVQDEDLEVLYKFIRSLEMSVTDLDEITNIAAKSEEERYLEAKKERFFDFVKKHSFTLPADYTFNREEIHER